MTSWLLGAAGALLLVIGIQTWRIDGLQEKNAGYEVVIGQYQEAQEQNTQAIGQCRETNLANLREATRQSQIARDAEIRSRMLRAELDAELARIPDEAERFKDDEILRTPFPADFTDWLRDT